MYYLFLEYNTNEEIYEILEKMKSIYVPGLECLGVFENSILNTYILYNTETFSDKKVYAQEMYDYSKDPLEKENVFADKNYSKVAQEMHEKMVSFFASQVKK